MTNNTKSRQTFTSLHSLQMDCGNSSISFPPKHGCYIPKHEKKRSNGEMDMKQFWLSCSQDKIAIWEKLILLSQFIPFLFFFFPNIHTSHSSFTTLHSYFAGIFVCVVCYIHSLNQYYDTKVFIICH